MSLLQGTNYLLNTLRDAVDDIPVVGGGLNAYVKYWQDYINKNAAPQLRHPEYYEKDPKTGKIRGIPDQKYIPTSNVLESAIGKHYGGAGSLGPRKLSDMHKPIIPKIFSLMAPLKKPVDPLQGLSDFGWNSGYIQTEPVIDILKTRGRREILNFAANKTEQPNANFPTTGFTRTRNKSGKEKIYRVVI